MLEPLNSPARRGFLRLLAAATFAGPGARLGLAFPQAADDRAYEALWTEYLRRHSQFGAALTKLASEFDQEGLAADAADLRGWAARPDEGALEFDDLPDTILPAISQAYPPRERELRSRLRAIRRDYAGDLFQLSLKSRQKAQYSLTWRLVREAAYHDSDHARARALLGYVKIQDRWTTPFRRQMEREGKVWHERFGWLPAKDIPRYDAGERRFRDRWLSVEREAAVRADFTNAWEAASEHFLVVTNHSLERGVEITVSLERFHTWFLRTFATVFMSPAQLQQLLEGSQSGAARTGTRHVVHYYRDQNEFRRRLTPKQPEAAFSNGIYMPSDRIAYFFHRPDVPEEVEETLYHETTHQILGESLKRPAEIGGDANFWLVEGLACYLESFRPTAHGASVGDRSHIRLLWARRFLEDPEQRFFLPLERFTSLGQREFQCMGMVNGPPRVARLQRHYAQAAGVTHFFLHYGDGEHREALMTYLAQLYSPDARIRSRVTPLDALTGVSFAELDRQYEEHILAE
ncbi:MAG: hypothetical protein KF774_11920 [Planctomyces sp.]|nr:hypothetical protein [Planctomyces sp.]